jgi:hypothetical protein
MWKNAVQRDTSQMTIKYGACALHTGQLRLHTLGILNACQRERVSVLRLRTLPILFKRNLSCQHLGGASKFGHRD